MILSLCASLMKKHHSYYVSSILFFSLNLTDRLDLCNFLGKLVEQSVMR